jgi:hypothetical protein
LELPLDDSKALVVTSFNEGFVPKSAGADAFLPDRLRKELGLLHNERRYARDGYATSVLCHSREELRVLFARKTRRDTQDNPLQPSRLLFACSDADLVRRAGRYFAEHKSPPAPRALLLARREPILEKSLFAPPKPVALEKALERISVTRFKSYLACPYRYYLRHVRKLEAVGDAARELTGGAFGTLVHKTLGTFGRDPNGPRNSERQREILDYLIERLTNFAEAMYGRTQRRPSIRLQLEQAQRRLEGFAKCQAELVQAGWRILYAEDEEEDELSVPFPCGEGLITLVGRIDRIDFHEERRELLILDYKTGDSAQTPEKSHRKKETWIDLQLPLYRHLWPALRLGVPTEPEIRLGYFNLPKKLEETSVALAEWDADTLQDATNAAKAAIAKILRNAFWPPEYNPVPEFCDDLAAICLDNVLGRRTLPDENEGVGE